MAEAVPPMTNDEVLANTSIELARSLARERRLMEANRSLAEENAALHTIITQLQTPQKPQKGETPPDVPAGAPRRVRRAAARKGGKVVSLPITEEQPEDGMG